MCGVLAHYWRQKQRCWHLKQGDGVVFITLLMAKQDFITQEIAFVSTGYPSQSGYKS